MTTPRNLELSIDHLVLHGVSPRHRRRVVEAIEKELQRLFAREGGATASGPRGGLALGAREVPVAAGLDPERLGARVAGAVWDSYRREKSPLDPPFSKGGKPEAPLDPPTSTSAFASDLPGGDDR